MYTVRDNGPQAALRPDGIWIFRERTEKPVFRNGDLTIYAVQFDCFYMDFSALRAAGQFHSAEGGRK